MSIVVKNLKHEYSQGNDQVTAALKEVTITIEEGEFLGIIGHTGSGKTTFVQHLNGLLMPTDGTIFVDGVDLAQKKASLKEIRRKVGLVFQYPENQLFEETVYKDIAFGPKNLGLDEKEIDERVKAAFDLVKLDFDKYSECSPFELSGGQMRRVAIAGVIAMHPKYLVLDEPTAGLDPRGRDAILSMIKNLHKHEDITIIMVTHNMDDIAKLASRIVLFHNGELIKSGTPREIFLDEEMLKEIGLDVPHASQLAHRLNKAGFDIPYDLYKVDELKKHLAKLLKEKGTC